MNSMTNIPQFYQDMMRSPFAAAAAAHFANNNQQKQFHHHQHQQHTLAMSNNHAQPPQPPNQLQMAAVAANQHLFNQHAAAAAAMAAMAAHAQAVNHHNKVPLAQQMFQQQQQAVQTNQFNQFAQYNKQHHNFPEVNLQSKLKQVPIPNNQSQVVNVNNRGRGRPPRQRVDTTNNNLVTQDKVQNQSSTTSFYNNNNNNSMNNHHYQPSLNTINISPGQSPRSQSRSRSPHGSINKKNGVEQLEDEVKTRTSTPSKANNSNLADEDEVYSSIYEGEDTHEHLDELNEDENEQEIVEEALNMEDIEEEDDRHTNVQNDLSDLEVDEELEEDGTEITEELDEEEDLDDELNATTTTTSTKSIKRAKKELKTINQTAKLEISTNNATNNRPVYDFTLQALEMSLYGYLRQTDPLFMGHAISGLRYLAAQQQHQQQQQQLNALSSPLNQNSPEDNRRENLSSSSSSTSSSSSIRSSASESPSFSSNFVNNNHSNKISSGNKQKSSFSIENLLTSSNSPSAPSALVPGTSSSSSSSSSSTSSNLNLNFHQINSHAHPNISPYPQSHFKHQPSMSEFDKLDLPDELQIRPTYLPDLIHYGVFCKKTVITKNTRFGPYPGKTLNPNEIKTNEDNNNMWEIFNDGRLSHFIDGKPTSTPSSSKATNQNQWMVYINCARFAQEQNLIAVQSEGEIFYEVCKDIAQGQELLVWYGDSYLQFLGIPVSLKDMTDEINEETDENKDGYTCDRCGKVFAYKYYRDKHLKYTRCVDQGDRKFPCHLCTRSFEKRDRLRIHILHVHEKHRPHKCTVCAKSFSQSSSLNKHMRVHSGERPYKCVYCNKAFTASSILRTHIRQHSGEKPFKCKYCGKAFASHAAHDSHVRRTHCVNKEKEANLIL